MIQISSFVVIITTVITLLVVGVHMKRMFPAITVTKEHDIPPFLGHPSTQGVNDF